MLSEAPQILAWIGEHPNWALGLLFAVALADALFIVGLFVPAAIVLFAMGALVALGSLDLWLTVAVAAAGALCGDTLSFILGRSLGERLFETRALRRYPDMFAGGRRFFVRHGGKSVFLARFLGPMRAVTPAIAGASHMSLLGFLVADSSASLIWAVLYVVPGMVFGASLALAAEVAVRLAVLLVLAAVVLVLGVWLTRLAIGLFQFRAQETLGALMDWSRRHRAFGRFGAALADPDQPETPALASVALLLLVSGAVWLFLWDGAGQRAYPGQFDALVYQTLYDLHTPWGTLIALAFSRLGEALVYGPAAAAVLAALLWRQKLRAAAHWVAALGFGALLWLGLGAVNILSAPVEFFGGEMGGSRDLVMPMVIYGFGAVLIATQRPQRVRSLAYGLSCGLLLLIVLARLYLGQEWWSLSVFSMLVGLLWVGALALGYRRHRPQRLFALSFTLPVLVVFVLAAATRWGMDGAYVETTTPEAQLQMDAGDWWRSGWQRLPPTIIDMRGRRRQAFDIQWAGRIEDIEASLREAGWQSATPVTGISALRWLTETTVIAELPVLPLMHGGQHPRLTLRMVGGDEHQRLIRLWASDWEVRTHADAPPLPIWLGLSVEQRARSFYRLLRYPVREIASLPLPPLPQGTQTLRVQRTDAGGRTLWLLGPRPKNFTVPFGDSAPASEPLSLEE